MSVWSGAIIGPCGVQVDEQSRRMLSHVEPILWNFLCCLRAATVLSYHGPCGEFVNLVNIGFDFSNQLFILLYSRSQRKAFDPFPPPEKVFALLLIYNPILDEWYLQ